MEQQGVIEFGESRKTMSSVEIAEIVGKPHNDVMKAIRAMEPSWKKVCQGKFSLTSRKVAQPKGGEREVPCYELTKTECLYVATKVTEGKFSRSEYKDSTGRSLPCFELTSCKTKRAVHLHRQPAHTLKFRQRWLVHYLTSLIQTCFSCYF